MDRIPFPPGDFSGTAHAKRLLKIFTISSLPSLLQPRGGAKCAGATALLPPLGVTAIAALHPN